MMKLVTYQFEGTTRIGAIKDQSIFDLTMFAKDMLSFIELGSDGLLKARQQLKNGQKTISLDEVQLLAPIPTPRRNVMCLGLNYSEHAAESLRVSGKKMEIPQFPIVFTKATTTVSGPFANIPFDRTVSEEIDWEVELAVIIGRGGRNIEPKEAMEHVYGYMVLNDISARDLQRNHKQFFKGKSLDGACPIGPWIVTTDELPDPHNLAIRCRVNGVLKQEANTSQMIFDIPSIVYHLSRGMSLLPGDIIATGTPSGVGFARQPPEFLAPGDVVECEVENIGVIRNPVVAVQ